MAVLLLNDHLLKATWPGTWWTGKLSDLAGLAFFPLFLQALWEAGQRLLRGRSRPSMRVLVIAAAATAVVFTAIQIVPLASQGYSWGLGALQWPFRALLSLAQGNPTPTLVPVYLYPDPTDLFCLPALALAVWAGRGRGVGPQQAQ